MRRIPLTALAVSALWPMLTVAQPWTPPSGPQSGYPGAYQPYPYGPPTGADQWSTPPEPPHALRPMPPRDRDWRDQDETPWSQQDDDWTAPRAPTAEPRLDVRRRATEKAYIIELRLNQLSPDQIEVRPIARGLLIQNNAASHFRQHQMRPDGQGYQYQQSWQRDASSRRIGLPPDANVGGMTREVKKGRLIIRVPRGTPQTGGRR